MPSFREVSQGMYGAWRLARFDAAAIAWFDRGVEGVWRSFWAAVICYPAFIMLLALKIAPAQWMAAGVLRILLVQSIGYVIGWVAFPLVILPFCRWLERDEQVLVFITAYNWSQVLQFAATLAIAALGAAALLPDSVMGLVEFITEIAILVYEWYIARTALEAGGVVATAVVLFDLVLAVGMGEVVQGLY